MSYTIIGRQVNLASRLETNASPDEILISKATRSLVQSRVRCARRDPVIAKGFAEPIEAYQVIGGLTEKAGDALIEFSSPALSLRLDTGSLDRDEREAVVRELQQALARVESSD